jgi:hypothetical protein
MSFQMQWMQCVRSSRRHVVVVGQEINKPLATSCAASVAVSESVVLPLRIPVKKNKIVFYVSFQSQYTSIISLYRLIINKVNNIQAGDTRRKIKRKSRHNPPLATHKTGQQNLSVHVPSSVH